MKLTDQAREYFRKEVAKGGKKPRRCSPLSKAVNVPARRLLPARRRNKVDDLWRHSPNNSGRVVITPVQRQPMTIASNRMWAAPTHSGAHGGKTWLPRIVKEILRRTGLNGS